MFKIQNEGEFLKYFFSIIVSLLVAIPVSGYFVYQYMQVQTFDIRAEYDQKIETLNEELKNYEDIKKAQLAEKSAAYFVRSFDELGQLYVWTLYRNVNGVEEQTDVGYQEGSYFKGEISPSGEKLAYWGGNELFVTNIKQPIVETPEPQTVKLTEYSPCNDTSNNADISWDNSSENIIYKVTINSSKVGEGCMDAIYSINIEDKKIKLLKQILLSDSTGGQIEIAGFIPDLTKSTETLNETKTEEDEKVTEEEKLEETKDEKTEDEKEIIEPEEKVEEAKPVEETEANKESQSQNTEIQTEEKVVTVEPTPEESISVEDNSNEEEYKTVMNYITSNFSSLYSAYTKGAYTISEFHFTQKSPYTYIIYKDEESSKKLLITYDSNKYTASAYYLKGESQDWILNSGKDTVYSEGKEVFFVNSSGGIASSTQITEGYRYFESGTYKFRMQYPSNWYYAGQGGAYYFSNKPIEESSPLVILKIVSATTQNQNSADMIYKYAKRSETENYELSGLPEYSNYINTMAESIENL